MSPVQGAYTLLQQITAALAPIGGAAAAVIAVTIAVRLLLHPLTRAAVRGEKAKSRLAPRVAELQREHAKDLPTMTRKLTELYRGEKISPFAGLLPMLVQVPFFIVLYQLFASTTIGGHGNGLLTERLFGVPLSARFVPQLPSLGAQAWVFLVLFAVLSLLAWLGSRRVAKLALLQPKPPEGLLMKLAQVAPYAILISAAFLPLAAGMYLATTTAWTAAENLLLRRGIPEPA
ncbi:YidC/Oxa1 family membrane protein insertase [Allocatelliglobosispora scoriae]|uniref:Membrane protein insertase YidC n=1 Tax=Allocatelliglobosispora scoriae TaxID=643052 RepID=A0A841C035_9ACTN|nr:membrane protein insertase YidC [Allocatelliglobosispora scoriae]MBB5873744.1 YidC/Oxa1 family membrane protein insertase [Allocatelliglobosispora scoriae]